ncbi:MAG: 5'-3' exonuclease H3TH domain-containing protein [Pseudomonadales bacterium]
MTITLSRMDKAWLAYMANRQAVYLLDASIYIFRSYFAMPDVWHNDQGYSLNAVHGYTLFLLKLLSELNPARIGAAFDESLGQCFRNDIYPEYKSSRALPDDSLAFQLKACKRITELLGIRSYAHKRYEADDLIATLARSSRTSGRPVHILSRDKDLAQLVKKPDDCVFDPVDSRRLDYDAIVEKFGVRPDQLIDYQTLLGDPVDDIPGVPGIGAKTAAKLLQHFDSLVVLLENLDELGNGEWRGGARLQQSLCEHREQMEVSRQLVQLLDQVPMAFSIADLQWQNPSLDAVKNYLKKIGLEGRILRTVENSDIWCPA